MSDAASPQHRLPKLRDVDTLNHRAAAYLARGKIQSAIDCFQRVVALCPDSSLAYQNLGEAQERLGDLAAAANSYQRAVALQPDSAELHCHLARVLYRGGILQPAAELYRRALTLKPKSHDICNDLGLVLTDLGNFAAATQIFRRSLILNPGCAKTIAGLGYMFERKGDLVSAADAYRDAVRLDPKLFAAYLDLGFVLYGLGELNEAADYYHRLLALKPDSAEATANLGLIHLRQGDLATGWAEYEWRWKVGIGDDRKLAQRRWKGEPLGGERILIYGEQGLGDTLQFVRYVPLVAARGGEVVLEVQPQLHTLLSGTEGASRVISRGETLPHFTWQCPMLSLPLAFGTELNTIPVVIPYVYPDPARMETWRQRLQSLCENSWIPAFAGMTSSRGSSECSDVIPAQAGIHSKPRETRVLTQTLQPGTRRIGLVWSGNPIHHRDRLRSVHLQQLASLLSVSRTTFYSLQVGPAREQIREILPGMRLVDLAGELNDFADTAAIVANLDLVISIDTAVAHLAGALGKPVWILLNKGCDWRWFEDREDSPWYPTARLFRQTTAGEWQDVVDRVERELRPST